MCMCVCVCVCVIYKISINIFEILQYLDVLFIIVTIHSIMLTNVPAEMLIVIFPLFSILTQVNFILVNSHKLISCFLKIF